MLATACPLCKKTFAKTNKLNVHDIAEIVCMALNTNKERPKKETYLYFHEVKHLEETKIKMNIH